MTLLRALALMAQVLGGPYSDREDDLVALAESGRVRELQEAIDRGADPNVRDGLGFTPLARAAQFGHHDVVAALLEWEADPTLRGYGKESAIDLACLGGDQPEIVRMLIDAGCDPVVGGGAGHTPLMWASLYGRIATAEYLLSIPEIREGLEAVCNSRETPLIHATTAEHWDVARLLIDHGASVNVRSKHGETPLMMAARAGQADLVELMIEKGAGVSAATGDGWSALSNAISRAPLEAVPATVDLLVAAGADVTIAVDQGAMYQDLGTELSPLFLAVGRAVWEGDEALVRSVSSMLEAGAEPNRATTKGWRAIEIAAAGGLPSVEAVDGRPEMKLRSADADRVARNVCEVLIEHGSPNSPDAVLLAMGHGLMETATYLVEDAELPIHFFFDESDIYDALAAGAGDAALAGVLLDRLFDQGLDPQFVRATGETPLHVLAPCGPCVESLLRRTKAQINEQDEKGRTPLHRAATHPRAMSALLAAGADPGTADHEGKTVLDHVLEHARWGDENLEPLSVFLRHAMEAEPNLEKRQNLAQSVLIHVAGIGRAEPLRAVIDEAGGCIEVNAANEHGETALIIAAKTKWTWGGEAVEFLADQGADLEASDDAGRTALDHAIESGRTRAARTLVREGASPPALEALAEDYKLSRAAKEFPETHTSLLLELGADPNQVDAEGWSPGMYAVARGEPLMLLQLLEHGAELSLEQTVAAITNQGTMISGSNWAERFDCLNLLLDSGALEPAELELSAETANTLLHALIGSDLSQRVWRSGSDERLEWLELVLRLGADPNDTMTSGTAVMLTGPIEPRSDIVSVTMDLCRYVTPQDVPLIRTLLEAGADVNYQSPQHGLTAIMEAVGLRPPDGLIDLLCGAGADINLQSRAGWTALHFACSSQHSSSVKDLLRNGARADLTTTRGSTPLHVAACVGTPEQVGLLVDAGASVDARDDLGRTPLLLAAGRFLVEEDQAWLSTDANERMNTTRSSASLARLLSAGSDPDVQDTHGWTALHLAANGGLNEQVRILLEAGADVNVANAQGDLPIDLAIRGGHVEATDMLDRAGLPAAANQAPLDVP